ncbi:hypothetical protein NNO_0471 [Hydrogenimonas sp.]|nr:hypothetical protein NNO_0471 [Hydrogenimonas sp.]
MNYVKSLFYLLFGLFAVTLFYGFSAGKILDISQKPQKADIIAVLGGDWLGFRVKKALQLYQNGFSLKSKVIVNGCQQIYLREKGKVYRTEKSYLSSNGLTRENIDTLAIRGNTMDEIESIKKYMLQHGYTSLIIVTDPPHTRRVRMLTKIAGYPEAGIRTVFIGADVPWWNREKYYKDVQALRYAVFETVKIPFNYLAYGVIEKLGLGPFVSNYFQGTVIWLKAKVTNFLNAL